MLAVVMLLPQGGDVAVVEVRFQAHHAVDDTAGGDFYDAVGDGVDELKVVGGEEEHVREFG